MKRIYIILIFLVCIGLVDAGYLVYEHYLNIIPPCSTSLLFIDCGKVLRSQYSMIFGVPLALIGLIHYSFLFSTLMAGFILRKRSGRVIASLLTITGFISSIYFVFLQLVVIKAICIFCMVSAATSTFLFFLFQINFPDERRYLILWPISFMYQHLLKPLFFLIDPEIIHNHMTDNGQWLGKFRLSKKILPLLFTVRKPALEQHIAGINFKNPIGLAAGFDYEAKLTQILPSIGFGFQTVGTITNNPYEGNSRPMLGRLPKSKSLMVNKGFKNLGVKKTLEKLSGLSFTIPVGISIGRTNSRTRMTQKQSVDDIINAFKSVEKSSIPHSYYELNISCPNLYGDISFYPKKNLSELLTQVNKLRLSRPVFIKMPIEKSDKEIIEMLEVIADFSPAGVIFGNLQKDRKNPVLDPSEVAKFPIGNFSGKPTFERSNELIKLSYKLYKDRFIIIGCGGVFSAKDAYEKITLGASLVQLITGMIYKGPQLITEINMELNDLLRNDGFTKLHQAIGSRNAKD